MIRLAKPSDAHTVKAILEESYPILLAAAYKRDLLDLALPLLTSPNARLLASGTYFIAEANGEPAACGGWSAEAPRTDTVIAGLGHIRHFATVASKAGQGHGTKLYAACEVSARKRGIRRFQALATLSGEAFYHALGFKSVDLVKVTLAPDIVFPSVVMIRDI